MHTETRIGSCCTASSLGGNQHRDGNKSELRRTHSGNPEIVNLIAAMLEAREAVGRRSWSHPQEPTGEEWWADVLADARARKRERRTDLAVKQAFYRLADEKREIILCRVQQVRLGCGVGSRRTDHRPWCGLHGA